MHPTRWSTHGTTLGFQMNDMPSQAEAFLQLMDLYRVMAEHASDIAFAKKMLYNSYISEGFSPEQALELCKVPLA